MNRSTRATRLKLMAGTAAIGLTLTACGSSTNDKQAADPTSPSTSPSESAPTETTSQAAPVSETFTNDKCGNNATSANFFKAGGILPLTGNLAYLGPPEISGVGLAVSEINAAGGVGGTDACQDIQDSGDSTDLSISTSTANTLIAGEPSVVIGAASSSVSLNVVDAFAKNKIVEISPANTAVDLSGYSPYYFRTAPPDGIQGNALGTLISSDGASRVAFIVFNDSYGTGLRNVVQKTVEASGGQCVYACQGQGDEFPPGQTSFSSEVRGALNAKPDAIVVLAFDETKSIVPELVAQGFDVSKIYLSDGNTADYSADFEKGTLEGAQGTIPGADPDQSFKDRLTGWFKQTQNGDLKDFAYGAESYDATILAALAAVKGGDTLSPTIQKNLAAVSGANGGEKCTSYTDCVDLLKGGSDIQYTGPSGIGPFDKQNDPSSAFVGIFTYNANNKNELTSSVEGSKQ